MPDEQLHLDLGPDFVGHQVEPEPTDAELVEHLRGELVQARGERDEARLAYEQLAMFAGDDVRRVVGALGLGEHARPYSPHMTIEREVLPAIALLRGTQRLVDAAQLEVEDRVKRAGLSGIPELDLGNGEKAQLVGRRLPEAEARALGIRRGA